MTSKRARLPGADELFRRTSEGQAPDAPPTESPKPHTAESIPSYGAESAQVEVDSPPRPLVSSSTRQRDTEPLDRQGSEQSSRQIAEHPKQLSHKKLPPEGAESPRSRPLEDEPRPSVEPPDHGKTRRRPRHDEKVTFYCTFEELTRLDEARLKLRRESAIVTDRGGLIRAAVTRALDELEREGEASALAQALSHGTNARRTGD
jgi:hypothetical protein